MEAVKTHLFENKGHTTLMHLKVFVDKDFPELRQLYEAAIQKHNTNLVANQFLDAGFDLYTPEQMTVSEPLTFVNFRVQCSAQLIHDSGKTHYCGYSLYPRSSLSKTNLMMANCVGVIDSGYRNHILGAFKLVPSNKDGIIALTQEVEKHGRLVQICHPSYCPIYVEWVDHFEQLSVPTERNMGGFGST
jgi:dUTP pyrophosphatase